MSLLSRNTGLLSCGKEGREVVATVKQLLLVTHFRLPLRPHLYVPELDGVIAAGGHQETRNMAAETEVLVGVGGIEGRREGMRERERGKGREGGEEGRREKGREEARRRRYTYV